MRSRPVSGTDAKEFWNSRWLDSGFVDVTVLRELPGEVRTVSVGTKVDEESLGPLAEGEDPLKLFKSIRARLLKMKAVGKFAFKDKEFTARHLQWTRGARQRWENGDRLIDDAGEVIPIFET